MISHKQRNTAEFLRIPCFRVDPPGIFHKESPQEIKNICKEARPHRPSSEYLADSARKSTRGPQDTKFHCARVSTSSKMPTCDGKEVQHAHFMPIVGVGKRGVY